MKDKVTMDPFISFLLIKLQESSSDTANMLGDEGGYANLKYPLYLPQYLYSCNINKFRFLIRWQKKFSEEISFNDLILHRKLRLSLVPLTANILSFIRLQSNLKVQM